MQLVKNPNVLDISLDKEFTPNEIKLLKESHQSVICAYENFYNNFVDRNNISNSNLMLSILSKYQDHDSFINNITRLLFAKNLLKENSSIKTIIVENEVMEECIRGNHESFGDIDVVKKNKRNKNTFCIQL